MFTKKIQVSHVAAFQFYEEANCKNMFQQWATSSNMFIYSSWRDSLRGTKPLKRLKKFSVSLLCRITYLVDIQKFPGPIYGLSLSLSDVTRTVPRFLFVCSSRILLKSLFFILLGTARNQEGISSTHLDVLAANVTLVF